MVSTGAVENERPVKLLPASTSEIALKAATAAHHHCLFRQSHGLILARGSTTL
jgi:hypothetical protein